MGSAPPPRDLVDFTFSGKLKSAIGQFSRDRYTLGRIIEETKSSTHPILNSLDFLNYSPWPMEETMRQVHLTAASFSALLDREPPKPLSGSPPVIPHATDGASNVGKLIELAKQISLNFAHRLEGWVMTLCGNSSGLGDDHGTSPSHRCWAPSPLLRANYWLHLTR